MQVRRGRFAPTPSGQLHIGNAMTALLAWLQMRHAGGQFVLRMEDIDKPRSRAELAEETLHDLRWLGMDWDEGPDIAGPRAPYNQSEREGLYEAAISRLQQGGWLYPCYCSRADIAAAAAAPHGLASEGPIYPGTCRNLTLSEREEKGRLKQPSLRFAMPLKHSVQYHDAAAGEQIREPGAGGDFVVKRADGIFAYQLAVVVDDAAMGITDVLRGQDLLDSAHRQLLLFEALGLEAPQYSHVPLMHGPDGQRLAKRHGSLAVSAMRQAGASPEQVVGWLAYLCGQHDRPEPVEAADLAPGFDIARVPKKRIIIPKEMLQQLLG
jgi:glutamyl-tRNA synthetase